MATARAKQERLEARITREQKEFFQRAAEIRGTTLTEFVISAVQEAALNTVRDNEVLRLSGEDREVFINALLNPPPLNDALKEAIREYQNVAEQQPDGSVHIQLRN